MCTVIGMDHMYVLGAWHGSIIWIDERSARLCSKDNLDRSATKPSIANNVMLGTQHITSNILRATQLRVRNRPVRNRCLKAAFCTTQTVQQNIAPPSQTYGLRFWKTNNEHEHMYAKPTARRQNNPNANTQNPHIMTRHIETTTAAKPRRTQ